MLSEGEIGELVYPGQGEVLGVVTKLLGFDRIMLNAKMAQNVYAESEAK